MKKYFLILTLAIAFTNCDNDSNPTTTEVGDLNLVFDNKVDTNDLNLDSQTYSNASDEGYIVSELKYIISNIELTKADGEVYSIPATDSYFVIDEAGNTTASLSDIPAGDYISVRFGFGVDPTKYPIESGTLNFIPTAEEAGMLWTWSAGYKFLKFEGTYSTTTDTGDSNPFLYHVGSHGANLDNYKEVTLAFTKTITTENTVSQNITFDVAKIFDSINTMSLVTKDDIQVDPVNAPQIAENVRTAFSIE